MLSNRTLGKFFTIQSLCLEEVRARRVFLLALPTKYRCSLADVSPVELSTLDSRQMNQLLA